MTTLDILKTLMIQKGLSMICNTCHEDLPNENFEIHYKPTGLRRKKCKSCHSKYKLNWARNNPEKRKKALLKFAEKNKRKNCVICKKKFTPSAKVNSCSIKCRLLEGREIDKTTGCWNWKFSKSQFGYGKLHVNSKDKTAHRLSYEIWKGEIPENIFVLHKCDNPSCFNPSHLYLGDQKQNMKDRGDRDRLLKGEINPSAVLVNEEAFEIRNMYKIGFSQTEIGELFGVSQSSIHRIVNMKSYIFEDK